MISPKTIVGFQNHVYKTSGNTECPIGCCTATPTNAPLPINSAIETVISE